MVPFSRQLKGVITKEILQPYQFSELKHIEADDLAQKLDIIVYFLCCSSF